MTTQASSSRGVAKFLAIGAVAVGLVPGLIGAFVIPRFQAVFESFGADLPWQTKLLVDFPYFLWTPLILSLILWWPLRSDRARIASYAIILVCEFVSLPLILIYLYLPIFDLGKPG
jgi:hypothetical protein